MRNFKKILILFIAIISYYIFYNFNTFDKKVIKIPPIVIEPNNKEVNRVENIANIILRLKKAIDKNKKSQKINKKEEAKKILERLKESIPIQSNISSPQIKKIIIPKRVVKKHLHKKAKKKIVKKVVKIIEKRQTKKKLTLKNIKKRDKITILKTKNRVVDTSTATTDEFKELPFVKPIEIIKISKPFEASNINSID